MAVNTFKWSRFNQERFRSMKLRPALRMISAISSDGRFIYSSSCARKAANFSWSRGLAVAFIRAFERCRYSVVSSRSRWPSSS